MMLARDMQGAPLAAATVLTIGAFDGVHLGHQALLAHVIGRARELDCAAAVVSFEPLPREYFARAPLLRLQPAAARIAALDQLGLDRLLLLRFNAALAALDPEQFVEQVVVRRLRARELWIGADFRFGRERRGDVALLQQLAPRHGYAVQVCATEHLGELKVSASAVREALQRSDFLLAGQLLGRPYAYCRRVIHGRQLGRQLGFPTANLPWGSATAPFSGIFAVRVSGAGLAHHPAIASLGTRPTIEGGGRPLLEVHLFDYDGDLYGQRLSIEFVAKQRDELKFDSLDALVRQMHADCAEARARLAQPRPQA